MELQHIATFLRKRVADLQSHLETALKGLGDGHTCNLALIQASLWSINATVSSIEDICPLLEAEKESRLDPRILMSMLGFPLPEDAKPAEEPVIPKDPIPNDPLPDRDISTSGKSSAPVDPATSVTQ